MCSYVVTEYITQYFSLEGKFESGDVYASLMAASVGGIGGFILWGVKEWGWAVKGTLVYLSIFVLGLIAISFLIPHYPEPRFWSLRLGYIASLTVLVFLGWRTHQIRFPQLACFLIIVGNLMALLSLVPWRIKPAEHELCGAVLTTQSYKTNYALYSEALHLWSTPPRPQSGMLACAKPPRVAMGEIFHGPYKIVRSDGSVTHGDFNYGQTSDVLLACRYKSSEEF